MVGSAVDSGRLLVSGCADRSMASSEESAEHKQCLLSGKILRTHHHQGKSVVSDNTGRQYCTGVTLRAARSLFVQHAMSMLSSSSMHVELKEYSRRSSTC